MRRFAITLGLAAALAGATAAPAAAHTITPTSFDFGTFGLSIESSSAQFTVTAVGTDLDGQAEVLSGDKGEFRTSVSLVPPASRCGNGTLNAGESCSFNAIFIGSSRPGSFSAAVGIEGAPAATVIATTASSPSKGKKKKGCKKKGKKGAAAAKKKKCKKKGKK